MISGLAQNFFAKSQSLIRAYDPAVRTPVMDGTRLVYGQSQREIMGGLARLAAFVYIGGLNFKGDI